MGCYNVRTQVKDRVIVSMKQYLSTDVLQILETVLSKELSMVNVEEITTLPAELRDSIEVQNRNIIELFQYKKRALKAGTKDNYIRAIRNLITLIYKPLTQIDDMDIFNYLQWYERKNMPTTGKRNQNSTINNERLYLSAFFNWMRKEKLRTDNPVESTEKRKVVRKPIDYFKQEDIAKLRDACQTERERAIIEVFRSTGARINEIVPIEIDTIDWMSGDILIQGEKGDRYRTIYLDADARYYLKKYLDSRTDNNPYLFVQSRGKCDLLHDCGIRTIMKDIAKRAGVTCRVYPHKMRKTLGMTLKNKGVDIGIIQEVLVHANPAVTATYYAQSTPDTLRKVREIYAA